MKKVNVKPGLCVRLTGRNYTSTRGGVYDLAALGCTDEDVSRVTALEGVTPHTGKAPAASKKNGGAE